MTRIVALLPDGGFERLRNSLGATARIVRVGTACQLRTQLAVGADLVVLDPGQLPDRLEDLREVARGLPGGKLVFYTSLHTDSVRALLALTLGTCPPLLIGGVEDSPTHLRRLVDETTRCHQAERFATHLLQALSLPQEVARVMRTALLQGHECRSVAALARLARTTDRSLNRWLRRSNLPPAQLLLAFIRLAAGREWILNSSIPLDTVSERLNYRSSRTSARHVRRLTGCPPSYWRRSGSVDGFLAALVHGLQAAAQL